MTKKGKTLESHRLWREVVTLQTEEINKVLQGLVDKRFTIGEAIEVWFTAIHN